MFDILDTFLKRKISQITKIYQNCVWTWKGYLSIWRYHTSGLKLQKIILMLSDLFFFLRIEKETQLFYQTYITLKLSLAKIGFQKNGQLSIITRNENILSKSWANQVW